MIPPEIGRIPVKYHLYWAGSDRDGAVAGYFFAVVETTAIAEAGLSLPSLPGPKPRDYRFTSKTDSAFVFTTSEDVNTREHAFFVYAVDNKGKPDPTPARFMFRAFDRFPPVIYFEDANTKAVGRTYSVQQTGPGTGFLIPTIRDYPIRDSLDRLTLPSDTIPSGSLLTFKWRAEPRVRGTYVASYKYKLDETDFNAADSSVHVATYNTGIGADVVSPGLKVFTVKALGQSGFAGQSTRRFIMNFDPDTWFAGPDKNDPAQGWSSHQDGAGRSYYYKDIASWANFTGVTNTQYGPDSLTILPAFRSPKRTFFEIYNNRLWYHEEGDTVHMNSWVLLPAGGLDRDSPYKVDANQRDVPPGGPWPVVTKTDTANGSPVGFRIRIQTKTDGPTITPSETSKYPVFDAASVFHQPVINAYWPMVLSGQAYALVRAEDGDGAIDGRVRDAVDVVDNPGRYSADIRSKVLTFFVNKAPFLLRNDPNFRPPLVPAVPTYTDSNWTATTGAVNRPLNLVADDNDPYYLGVSRRTVGGSNFADNRKILRRSVRIFCKNRQGVDTLYTVTASANPADTLFYDAAIPVRLPTYVANGPITIRINLCDCERCEEVPGAGRCVFTDIPATLAVPGRTAAPEAPPSSATSTQRPGSPSAVRRSF